MSKSSRFAIILLPVLLAACTTARNPAPVLDRTAGAKQSNHPASAATSVTRQADPHGFYTVRRGDTLIQIALDFGQSYRDIVAWNNLLDPNDIKVDQVLRVLPPEGAAQTAAVATSPGIEVRPLGEGGATTEVPNKTEPRGEKQPYPESNAAEAQKAERDRPQAPARGQAPSQSRQQAQTSPLLPDDENISWIWPVEGKVIAPFGEGRRGIAISGRLGQPVLAAGPGKVLYAGSGIRGYGNLVIVKHTNNLLSAYAHNKTIFVKEDQTVTQGQKIAEMGNSDTDEVKLHFEIRHQGKPVDPARFLPRR